MITAVEKGVTGRAKAKAAGTRWVENEKERASQKLEAATASVRRWERENAGSIAVAFTTAAGTTTAPCGMKDVSP